MEVLPRGNSIWADGPENIITDNDNEKSIQTFILENPQEWTAESAEILVRGDFHFPFFIEQKIYVPPQKNTEVG